MSPKVQRRTKTSTIWQFFSPVNTEYAKCNMCNSKLSYKTSTSNLVKHLNRKHPTVTIVPDERYQISEPQPSTSGLSGPHLQATTTSTSVSQLQTQPSTSSQPHPQRDISDSEPQPSTSLQSQQIPVKSRLYQTRVETFLPRKITPRSKEIIDEKLLGLFMKDLQPFSIVEDAGFRDFVEALNPAYQSPTRHVLTKTMLPALYEKCSTSTKSLISTGKAFCVTTDSWSSINNTSYIAFTAHFLDEDFKLYSVLLECSASDLSHTSENLSSELRRVVVEWGIEDKIILAVSDNAANIRKALSDLGWRQLGCIAHTINLIVKDTLKHEAIGSIIDNVKEIVKHFRRSNASNDKLLKYQQNLGKTPLKLKLILEVATRWNSTFYMLKRFVELEEAIKSTLAIIDRDLASLNNSEWKIIKELCIVLKPFEDASRTLSGEKYCTAALVIPMYNGLRKVFDKLLEKDFSEPVKEVVQLLDTGLSRRLGNVENSNTLCFSTFLDPKFKDIGFSDKSKAEQTRNKIQSLVAEKITKKTKPQPEANISTSIREEQLNTDDEEMSIWLDFDKTVAESQPKGTSTTRAIIEMQRYMEEDILHRNSDSLLWWQERKQMLPHLSEIAQERLCALASSVPCERLFSKAGQILTERWNRLSDKNVQMLLFLNSNSKYLQ